MNRDEQVKLKMSQKEDETFESSEDNAVESQSNNGRPSKLVNARHKLNAEALRRLEIPDDDLYSEVRELLSN